MLRTTPQAMPEAPPAIDGFVDDKNVGAGAPAGRFQHLGEVEGRAQPVNPRADDGVFDRLRNRPVASLTHPARPGDPLAIEEDVTLLSIFRAH